MVFYGCNDFLNPDRSVNANMEAALHGPQSNNSLFFAKVPPSSLFRGGRYRWRSSATMMRWVLRSLNKMYEMRRKIATHFEQRNSTARTILWTDFSMLRDLTFAKKISTGITLIFRYLIHPFIVTLCLHNASVNFFTSDQITYLLRFIASIFRSKLQLWNQPLCLLRVVDQITYLLRFIASI